MLDERKRKILRAIINDYILTAEPVGSRTIARNHDLGVSPATIRNEMADLEALGYIEQPHTSAGRVPSGQGYRFYVDCLLAPTMLSENDEVLIRSWYEAKVRSLEQVFQETAKILSRMTRNVSLVLAPQFSNLTFKYLQFLPLDNKRVILVIVTSSGYVENKVINLPADMAFSDLQRLADIINNRLAGLSLDKIKLSFLQKIKNDILVDSDLYKSMLEVLRRALSFEKDKRVYLGGTTQLISQPEFRDVDKVKELLTMLEEEPLLCDILHVPDNDGVVVTIGQENKYSGIKDCSMVQATYRVDGMVIGTVAVLGPTRMDYGKIMAILDFMHDHLGEVLRKYKF